MKEFLRRLLGVESLKAQVKLLKQEVDGLKEENGHMQELLTSLYSYKAPMLSQTQAAGIAAVIEDFKARNFRVIPMEG